MKIRKSADRVFSWLSRKELLTFIPDKIFLEICYYLKIGKKLNLKDPIGFNEKLQWIKLYDRNPFYTKLVDKYEVREFVKNRVGEEYLIPLIGVWDKFEDIEFETFPKQFVLKCTHDSGGLVICKNSKNFDYEYAKEKIKKCLKRDFYKLWREWPYKNVSHRIIAERFMEDYVSKELKDYKFYCFDGKVKVMVINSDRQSSESTKGSYFDREFNYLDLQWGFEDAYVIPEKPEKYEEMVRIAEKLSEGFIEVRVDLYLCNHKIYFGEMTFFDGSGFTKIRPEKWDYKLGSYIKLP